MELFGLKKITSSCSDLHEACPYTLKKVLQKGKCSVRIIKAVASESNEVVAIKLFPKTKDGKCLQAFLSEQKSIANLSHPYILKYHETFDDAVIESEDGNFVEYSAIVMEYIPQGDIHSVISRKPFSEKLARSVFKQMVTVVQYLHSQDLVHLDIKLENFLITPKDGIKLIDFEACQKYVKGGEKVLAKGTPGYRAPEILKSEDCLENYKALDIYSLGIVLFMMVAGTPPYVEQQENGEWKFDKYYETLRNDSQKFWRAHERYRLADGFKGFSEEFKTFIEGMIAENPNGRPKIEDLRRKSWFQGEVYSVEELENKLKEVLEKRGM